MMWLLCVLWAQGAPPVPTWDETTVERQEEVLPLVDPGVVPVAQGGPRQGVLRMDALAAPVHDWSDVAKLEVAVEGHVGVRYYLQLTSRVSGQVRHWRQGPFGGPQETLFERVLPPPEVLQSLGAGTLSVRVAPETLAGVALEETAMRPVRLALEAGEVVGREVREGRVAVDMGDGTMEER